MYYMRWTWVIPLLFVVSAVIYVSSYNLAPSDFENHMEIVVYPTGSEYLDQQVRILVDTNDLIASNVLKEDCSDIRFTDNTNQFIPYWIERGCDTNETYIWVKVPHILADSPTRIVLHSGNQSALYSAKLWDGVEHIHEYGGVFDYNIEVMRMNGDGGTTLSAGGAHTCFVLESGDVRCNGYSNYFMEYFGNDAVSVSAGHYHICVLRENGSVTCSGSNSNGRTDDYTGVDAVSISSGYMHNCVLKNNGNVYCWGVTSGSASKGQTVQYTGGDAVGVSTGEYHTCILLEDGNVDCYGQYYIPSAYFNLQDYTGGDAIAVASGKDHACVLKDNGNVECWGDNGAGQSADYSGGDAIAVAAGGDNTCILLRNGNVYCWGATGAGVTEGYSEGDAVSVSVGLDHACVLRASGNIFCWGSNGNNKAIEYTGEDVVVPFVKNWGIHFEYDILSSAQEGVGDNGESNGDSNEDGNGGDSGDGNNGESASGDGDETGDGLGLGEGSGGAGVQSEGSNNTIGYGGGGIVVVDVRGDDKQASSEDVSRGASGGLSAVQLFVSNYLAWAIIMGFGAGVVYYISKIRKQKLAKNGRIAKRPFKYYKR